VLCALAVEHPSAHFIGIDLQKAAVGKGRARIAREGLKNVDLQVGSFLDKIGTDCDFLISRAALIYLNEEEYMQFLRMRLPRLRQKVLLHEIISTNGRTGFSHFFAHPVPEFVERCSEGHFDAEVSLLDYGPWRNEGAWSGAEMVFTRHV
jgi:hypothetical protein